MPYIEQLHDNLEIPMLYVTHSLDELLHFADHLLLLENGRARALGPLNEMLTRTDLPLAYLEEAGVVLEGSVAEQHAHHQLTEINTRAGIFFTGHLPSPTGSAVRIRIAARDVSIALTHAQDSSISHILQARIDSIQPGVNPAKVLVTLSANEVTLLASVTLRSVDHLKLKIGQLVYAQVKSVALM